MCCSWQVLQSGTDPEWEAGHERISGCGPITGLGDQTGCNDHKDVKDVIRAEAAVLTQRNRSESVDVHTVMKHEAATAAILTILF